MLTRRLIIANALAWLGVLVLVGGGLYFVDQRDAQRSQDICGLITLLDVPLASPSPGATPSPALVRQQKILKAMHDYHQRLDCPS